MTIQIDVNGDARHVSADPATPLLWVLHDHLKLTGTKYSCGIAACGACAVQVDGGVVRACATPLSAVAGGRVVTVERLEQDRIGHAARTHPKISIALSKPRSASAGAVPGLCPHRAQAHPARPHRRRSP